MTIMFDYVCEQNSKNLAIKLLNCAKVTYDGIHFFGDAIKEATVDEDINEMGDLKIGDKYIASRINYDKSNHNIAIGFQTTYRVKKAEVHKIVDGKGHYYLNIYTHKKKRDYKFTLKETERFCLFKVDAIRDDCAALLKRYETGEFKLTRRGGIAKDGTKVRG